MDKNSGFTNVYSVLTERKQKNKCINRFNFEVRRGFLQDNS